MHNINNISNYINKYSVICVCTQVKFSFFHFKHSQSLQINPGGCVTII